MKMNANKIQRIYEDRVLEGFAGSAGDRLTLFTQFESKLEEYRENLVRSVA